VVEVAPALVVREITAGYGGAPVIQGVGFSAKSGELTAIVGPNGSGKSTLLKAVVGLLRQVQGSVELGGVDVTGMPTTELVRNGLSYVPQVANVFPSLNVRENLEMGAYARRSGVKEKVSQLLDMFPDLRSALKKPARNLSGGQRTMLAIARGLMLDPSVMILDEPTAGLSPRYVDAIWREIVKLRELNVAVVMVEQNTRRTLKEADLAYVLVLGRNRLCGTGKELLENPEVVDLYIGKEA
jgi:branched-chain amino acid transport system ATP-binding protein